MSKAKDKDSNKENYNYNISAHKIAIVIWIIIIFLLCVFILPFLLSSVAKILNGVQIIEKTKILSDFLGGMIGIVIGFFIESGLIKKYRRIDDFKAVYDSLEVYFGELKEKIEKDIKKENDIKNDAIDFNPYRYDFQLLRDVTNSIEKDSLFLNLPNYALSDSKEGKNIHRLLHEIKSNADDYDYYESCYERTIEYMSDEMSVVNKRAIVEELSKMNVEEFLTLTAEGYVIEDTFFGVKPKMFENYKIAPYENCSDAQSGQQSETKKKQGIWKSKIKFKIIKKGYFKKIEGKDFVQVNTNHKKIYNNIFLNELRLWEIAINKNDEEVKDVYLLCAGYLREYYLLKIGKALDIILKNIEEFLHKSVK